MLSQTRAQLLIHERVDANRRVRLVGNVRPEVQAGEDAGRVADSLPLTHMMLQLKRAPEQERALEQFIEDLHNPDSAAFHKWLTATEYGQRFGLAQADLNAITGWLQASGFKVNVVYPNGMVIDFSGTAGQVASAFHTTIHNVISNGVRHVANVSDPEIPEALAPAVSGVLSLHDFRPHMMARAVAKPGPRRTGSTNAQYTYTFQGQNYQALVPADLATIYDFNPQFAKGNTGKGQTIALVEDTLLYRTSDWTTFRSTFGLSQYNGTLTSVQPSPGSGGEACASPGITSDDVEATLDAEWALAAAPGATIEVASCADTETTPGLFIAAQNLVNGATPPPIISVSYGQCEALNGETFNRSWNTLFQQAVTEGVSVFVSSGDEGAAACDAGSTNATHGIGISGFASSPYAVAVGGTDFADGFNGNAAKYWSSTNTTTYGSALSYIPEIPWNDSCAGSLYASFKGYSTVYGPNGFCTSSAASQAGLLVVAGGSGGPSGCATGTPTNAGVVSGSCAGWPKPSWQQGLTGIPSDGVRDIPDVSMFASDGPEWGHYAVTCFSDTFNGGTSCRGTPQSWAGFGGTSLAAPIVAGIQALINQSLGGSPQGNPNPVYYSLAAKAPAAFHSVSQGDIDVNCAGPWNCYGILGTVTYGRGGRIFGTTYGGALSVDSRNFTPAYGTGNQWNFATGIGSIDVDALVKNWPTKQ